jgi:hypothetical protein
MFSISATGADFRTLDLGQSCTSAREWEVARGSTPMPGSAGPGADIYAFEGREFDRDVYLSYFCMHGVLFTGNHSFPIESLDQAVDSYRDIRERLLSVYGDTSSDASPWSGAGDMRSTGIDSPKYMTFWRTTRGSTTLSLMRNKPSERPGWRVFLVIGPVTKWAHSYRGRSILKIRIGGGHSGIAPWDGLQSRLCKLRRHIISVNRANAWTEFLGFRIADIGDRLLRVESSHMPSLRLRDERGNHTIHSRELP